MQPKPEMALSDPESLDAIAIAARMGLPIAPEYRAGVVEALSRLLDQAALVMALGLPPMPEPPPEFKP